MSKFAVGAIFAVVLIAGIVIGLGVLEEADEGPLEKATESVGDAVSSAAESVDEAAGEAADNVEDAVSQ